MTNAKGSKKAWNAILISNLITLVYGAGIIFCSILIWKEQNSLREFCLLLIFLGALIISNIFVIIFIARVNSKVICFNFFVHMILTSFVLLFGIFISIGQVRFNDYLKQELDLSYTKAKEIFDLMSDYSLAAQIASYLTVLFMVSFYDLIG